MQTDNILFTERISLIIATRLQNGDKWRGSMTEGNVVIAGHGNLCYTRDITNMRMRTADLSRVELHSLRDVAITDISLLIQIAFQYESVS